MATTNSSPASPRPANQPRRRPAKVATSVAREILHDIVDRGLAPGAKLPPEIEMAESLGVARASLREGLRILEVHGLITIKPGPGGGPVVAPISSDDLGQTLTFFLHASATTFREVMGARLVLEPLMARLAAERDDPAVRAALREAIDRAGGVADTDDHKYLDIATDFHDIVSGASGNGVLDLLTRSLKDIYVARIRSVVYEPGERARILQAHEAVAEAIISGDGDRAEELMREHMQDFVDRFEERFSGFMDERIDWF
ncbi:MAG: FadR/GntR family transcriptional regulator [bacterium]|nr:FadR/GntR family transcriptional regulator [bacterium]